MNLSFIEHLNSLLESMSDSFQTIKKLPEFERDLKKLKKKYSSIEEDLFIMIDAQLYPYHKKGVDNRGTFPINGIGIPEFTFYKVKKFACRSIRGKGSRTGIRVIYTYRDTIDQIELIEIYSKQEKANEDRNRITRHYKQK